MTGYTCSDYHHDGSLILCSVYYLHWGLVMFHTDRSVIRRIAQSHLFMLFNFFSPSLYICAFLKAFLDYLSSFLSVYRIGYVCRAPLHDVLIFPLFLASIHLLWLSICVRQHRLALCLHWFALGTVVLYCVRIGAWSTFTPNLWSVST